MNMGNREDKGESRSIWVNAAAIIGACTSLLVALNQIGILGNNPSSKLSEMQKTTSSSSADKNFIIAAPNSTQSPVNQNPEKLSSTSAQSITPESQSSTTKLSVGSSNRPAKTFPKIGILVAQDSNAQINVRDGPGLDSYNRHYGLAGDRVNIIGSTQSSDGSVWYHVKFPVSGANGWIRGDFIHVEE